MAVPIQRRAIRTNHFWIVARDYLVACPFILHRLGLCFNLEKPNSPYAVSDFTPSLNPFPRCGEGLQVFCSPSVNSGEGLGGRV